MGWNHQPDSIYVLFWFSRCHPEVFSPAALLKESHRMGIFGKFQHLTSVQESVWKEIDESDKYWWSKFAGINPRNTINIYSNGIFCVFVSFLYYKTYVAIWYSDNLAKWPWPKGHFKSKQRDSQVFTAATHTIKTMASWSHGPCTASMRRWVGWRWLLDCLLITEQFLDGRKVLRLDGRLDRRAPGVVGPSCPWRKFMRRNDGMGRDCMWKSLGGEPVVGSRFFSFFAILHPCLSSFLRHCFPHVWILLFPGVSNEH